MKKILIIGATGFLGSALMHYMSSSHTVVGTTNKYLNPDNPLLFHLDATRESDVRKILDQLKPDVVINCAGLANVDECEKRLQESFSLNTLIPSHLARSCSEHNIKFVQVSTDHFDTETNQPKKESDVVWPINVYGRTKLEAEKHTSDLSSDALIIRTNFFGRSVRNEKTLLDWIIRSLEQGQPLIGFTDVLFSPVNIRVLSDAILHLLQKNASGVINVSCNEVISKHRFMVMVAQTFNLPSELVRKGRSSDLETMTKRPLNLSLDNQKLRQLINWPLPSLQDMIGEVARARSH